LTLGKTLRKKRLDDARDSSCDSALVHAGRDKKPGKARPFFPSGLPHSDAPRWGFRLRRMRIYRRDERVVTESLSAQRD
jgi:hypothetical protein